MNNRFCVTCGGKLNSDDLFCPHCGAKVNPASQKQSSENHSPKESTFTPPSPSNQYGQSPVSTNVSYNSSSVNLAYPQPPYTAANPMLSHTSGSPYLGNTYVPFNQLPSKMQIAMVLQYVEIVLVFGMLLLLVFILGALFGIGTSENIGYSLFIFGGLILVVAVLVGYLTRRLQYRSSTARALVGLYHGLAVTSFAASASSLNFSVVSLLSALTSGFILYTLFFDKQTTSFFNGFGPPYSE